MLGLWIRGCALNTSPIPLFQGEKMNTPIVGRIYHVVDKTTNEVVKVGSTIQTLVKRWCCYNKKKYSNHFLKEVRIIESSELDWYEPKNPFCPFVWHLVAAEHMEILNRGTLKLNKLSNQRSPLDQKFFGLDGFVSGKVGGRIGGIISGRNSKDNKLGFFAPGMNVKGGQIQGPIQGAKNAAIPGRMASMGRIGGRKTLEGKKGIFAPENLGLGGRTNAQSGHLARIASSGGKIGGKKSVANMNHKHWHVRRGIKNTTCVLCREENNALVSESAT